MRKALAAVGCMVGVAVIGVLVNSGCEETTGRALTVAPAGITLSGTSNSVTFVVSTNDLGPLSLPLEWRVVNPALGSITTGGGMSAVYYRTSAGGDNIIMVEDQYGAEGVATVHQR